MHLKVVLLSVVALLGCSCHAQVQQIFSTQKNLFEDVAIAARRFEGRYSETINDSVFIKDTINLRKAEGGSGMELLYQWREITGPYPVGQGNNNTNYGIKAFWQTAIDSSARFSAAAVVNKGIQENICFNAMRLGHLYGPYTLISKRQADFKYQQYQLTAQYSVDFKKLLWTIGGDYTGDYAHTETDPRAKDISTWLGIHTAARVKLKNHLLELSLRYQHHSKNLDLDVWQGNVKYQFLLMRGFGMYDHDFTESVFNKKRWYRQNLFEIGVGGTLFKAHKTNLFLGLNWGRSTMTTEEQNTLNLHQLASRSLSANIVLNRVLTEQWQLTLSTAFDDFDQKGTENRYSLAKVNESYSGIYDYVKLGSIQPYNFRFNQLKALIHAVYSPTDQLRLDWFVGYGQTASQEKYTGTDFFTQIDKSQWEFGSSYANRYRKHEWIISVRFQPERLLKAKNTKDTTVESLYDQVYLPQYHYNSRDTDTYSLCFNYAYNWTKNQKMGVKLGVASIRGVHLDTGIYTAIEAKETVGSTSIYWLF